MDSGSVPDKHVGRVDHKERARRSETEERRDADALALSPVVRCGAEGIRADERAELGEPQGDLVPSLPPQHGDHLEGRIVGRGVGDRVVRDTEAAGDARAIATVAVEQLDDGRRLTERAHAVERLVVVDRVDHPHAAAGDDGVRSPLHEVRLRRDPADREVELVDEAHELDRSYAASALAAST